MMGPPLSPGKSCPRPFGRRQFLVGAGAAAAGLGAANLWRTRDAAAGTAEVVIARAESYDDRLVAVLREGLAALGIGRGWAVGRCVLLKPNLVEPSATAPHINTHPELVRAAAEVFRGWGAAEVVVAEGQGHCRDTGLVLDQSGLGTVLRRDKLEFVDLNHDDVFEVPNHRGATGLPSLFLPRTLRRAGRVVSMPKLKTHHWAGATLSMKNLFGVLPGCCYGWPKNPLHQRGIARSIFDINAAVRADLAIVDGVVGMEGDGPIMGDPVPCGLLILGTSLSAVDATGARLMGLDPSRLEYLARASGRLGPIAEANIRQRGEPIAALARRFRLLDHPSLTRLRPG